MTTYYTTFDSRIDPILLTSDGEALTGLYMIEHKHGPEIAPDWVRSDEAMPFAEAKRQLADYFAGTLTEFDLPLGAAGHGVSAARLGGVTTYRLWRNDLIRRTGAAHRAARQRPRRRACQWAQPDLHRRALSPSDRRERQVGRLRRRTDAQTGAALA